MRFRILSACMVLTFCLGGCVTESQSPAVTIRAGVTGKLYPPYFFRGTWQNSGRMLIMHRPPGPAVTIQGGMQGGQSYTIEALRRNSNGSYTFRLRPYQPALGSAYPRMIERTFLPPRGGRIVELRGGSRLPWVATTRQ